jgi:ATP-dependent Clp protease adaptor protein ClpS
VLKICSAVQEQVMAQRKGERQGETLTRERVEKPKRYKVLLHNDDYTTMEFVIHVLISIFQHSMAGATRIMLQCHRTGIGVAGVFTREVAETRIDQVMDLAREHGHPLQCTMEPE